MRSTVRHDALTQRLQALDPVFLEILNESDMHAGPPGRESHFRVRVVSAHFDGQRLVQRHRAVNALVKDLMGDGGIHALAIEAYTPADWSARGGVGAESPDCEGKRP